MRNHVALGELCLLTDERARHDYQRSPVIATVTDSAVMSRFEDLLELHDRALERRLPRLAEWYADRIVDAMTAGAAR